VSRRQLVWITKLSATRSHCASLKTNGSPRTVDNGFYLLSVTMPAYGAR